MTKAEVLKQLEALSDLTNDRGKVIVGNVYSWISAEPVVEKKAEALVMVPADAEPLHHKPIKKKK